MLDHIESCSECGQHTVTESIGRVVHRVGQREIIVDQDRHLVCGHCGNISYRGEMLDESQRKVASMLRQQDNLLTPDELRAIRLKYGFTQAEMEKLLTIGAKTWVRWERGKVVQSSAADQMIRQISKNPELLRDLMRSGGIRNDSAEKFLAAIDEEVEQRIAARLSENFPDLKHETLQAAARIAAAEVRRSQHGGADQAERTAA